MAVAASAGLLLVASLLVVLARRSDHDGRVVRSLGGSVATTTSTSVADTLAPTAPSTTTGSAVAAPTTSRPAAAPSHPRAAAAPTAPGVYVVGVDGSGKRLITGDQAAGGGGPAWSQDGSRLAYADSRLHLHVVGADGSGDHVISNLTVEPHAAAGAAALWAAEGFVVYAAWDGQHGSIHTVQPDGSGDRIVVDGQPRITSWGINGGGVAWSDGTRVWLQEYNRSYPTSVALVHPVDAGSLNVMLGELVFTAGGATWHHTGDGGVEQIGAFAADETDFFDAGDRLGYSGDGHFHLRDLGRGTESVTASDVHQTQGAVNSSDQLARLVFTDTSGALVTSDANGGSRRVITTVVGAHIVLHHGLAGDRVAYVVA